jgi:hypothetical protein
MAEWISTKDELPEVGKDVLGYNENDNKYFVVTYSDTYKSFFVGGFAYNNITHWQELPKPPRTPKERGGEK